MAVLPVRLLAGAVVYLRGPYGLRPVVSPVEVVRVSGVRILPAQHHAVYQTADQRDEAEYQEDYAENPAIDEKQN